MWEKIVNLQPDVIYIIVVDQRVSLSAASVGRISKETACTNTWWHKCVYHDETQLPGCPSAPGAFYLAKNDEDVRVVAWRQDENIGVRWTALCKAS